MTHRSQKELEEQQRDAAMKYLISFSQQEFSTYTLIITFVQNNTEDPPKNLINQHPGPNKKWENPRKRKKNVERSRVKKRGLKKKKRKKESCSLEI